MGFFKSGSLALVLLVLPGGLAFRPQRMVMSAGTLPGGSHVALVTPMKEDGALDLPRLQGLLEMHVQGGTDGIVALGTTGEATTMSMEERAEVLAATMEVCKGKIPVTVGVGTINPKATIAMAEQAASYGADATLVVTPYYVKPTQKGCITLFNHIAAETELPMVLYNVPGRTACDLQPETVAELATNPKIIGIKEATGEVSRVSPLRKLCGDDFLLLSGDDETSMAFCLAGGDGSISVTANLLPKEMHLMLTAAAAKDEKAALEINAPLDLLHQRLFLQSNPIPPKWALHRMGLIAQGIRLPMTWMEDEFIAPLEEALTGAGIALK